MAVRIIHTADVHLDSTFSGRLGAGKGTRKREAIRNTFRRIVDDCLSWPADILVIAGDLFEEERVSSDTIGFLKAQFARLKSMPVVISPGNHDPFTVGGRYAVTDWGPNVHIFTRGSMASFRFPAIGLNVCGAAHVSTHMSGRLSDVIRPAADGGPLALLVVHASDETAVPTDKASDDIWLPFTRSEIERLGYPYMALGHYHGPYDMSARGRVIAAYPGSPEGLRAGETGRRQYVRVTLDRDGAKVDRVPVSEIDFVDFEVACDAFQTREELYAAIRGAAIDNPTAAIARVTARGRVAPGFDLSAGLPDDVYERFFYIALINETVPAYDWEALSKERSLRGEVARRFAAEMDKADDAVRGILEKARLYAMDALEGRAIELPAEVRRVD